MEVMEQLSCRFVQASLWDYSAGSLAERLSESVAMHLGECRECDLRRLEVGSLRTGLRQLPVKYAPAILETRLQVLASRERSRLLARRDFSAWFGEKRLRVKLFVDNLLRPFAVPAAGGLLASFLCFGVVVDNLQLRPEWDNGRPTGLYTEVSIDEVSPFYAHGRDVLVQLTVDSGGHVTDYSLPQGNSSPEELQAIGNLVLYSSFIPATRFGLPIASKRLFIITSISVKG